MNRLNEEKKQQIIDFAKELNEYFNYDYGDPNQEESFYMSEMKLSKALMERGISVSQKTINRYRNGESRARKEVQEAIRSIFRELRERYEREDERSPEDSDFMMIYPSLEDDPYYDDGSGEEEFCQAMMEDEEYCTIGYMEDYDEDLIQEYEEYLNSLPDPLENDKNLVMEKLDLYTSEAVKYITDHVELFLYVDNTDVKFVKALQRLPEKKREGLVARLANLPETLEYIRLTGFSRTRRTDGFSFVGKTRYLYQGAHINGNELYNKLQLLRSQLQSADEVPRKIYGKVNKNTNKPVKACSEELRNRFKDEYRKVYLELENQERATDVDELTKIPTVNIRRDFFLHVNELLTFTDQDWYHLYLFVRLQLMELSEQHSQEETKLAEVFEGYLVQEKETILWRYLQMQEVL